MSDEFNKRRILVVDDDVSLARLISRKLAKAGYEVDTAHDGDEARAFLDQQAYDAVLSDVNMPGMDGLELLGAAHEVDLDLPVILLTGQPEVSAAARAVEYGAFRYLTKPVTPEAVIDVVARAVRVYDLARVKREALRDLGRQQSADRAGLGIALQRALDTLHMVYQPIARFSDRSIHGYEALVRSGEPSLPAPPILLETARKLGRMREVASKVHAAVARDIVGLPELPVFVNLHPDELVDPGLLTADSPLAPWASRVVLEITERADLPEEVVLKRRVEGFRSLGFRIAVDDLGEGYAGLSSFVRLGPDVAKVDMSLVHGIHESATKRRLVGAIVEFCMSSGIHLVCEGVENRAERNTLLGLGADLLQGFFFANPGPPFVPVDPAAWR